MSATSPTSKLPATGALEMHEDTALLQVLHWAAKLVESGGAQGAAGPGAPVAPARVTSGRTPGARPPPLPGGVFTVTVSRDEFEQLQQAVHTLFDMTHAKLSGAIETNQERAETWANYLNSQLGNLEERQSAIELRQPSISRAESERSAFAWVCGVLVLLAIAAVVWCVGMNATFRKFQLSSIVLQAEVEKQGKAIEELKAKAEAGAAGGGGAEGP